MKKYIAIVITDETLDIKDLMLNNINRINSTGSSGRIGYIYDRDSFSSLIDFIKLWNFNDRKFHFFNNASIHKLDSSGQRYIEVDGNKFISPSFITHTIITIPVGIVDFEALPTLIKLSI
ncbi:MAG: hypothetical protein KC414_13995 [Romboutsia sp.]|nr:hypothetical protein [Romboutsia sp.]